MEGLSFEIDELTNSIKCAQTSEIFETEVLPLTSSDLKQALKKNGWKFNWRQEYNIKDRQLYKLVIRENPQIQGLVSLKLMDNFIEMPLIETAPHNYGKLKRYIGAPGNLVAFACKLSFEKGFEGCVSFIAKTKLIQHYMDTLNAELTFGNRMKIETENARKLVNLYFKSFTS